ncbi:DUF4238 domain-containing protein [Mycobacterium sp. TY813]|uniref:DUF4238 domain-containing protein n=1 Tax=Mycobacterium TaxID=1763 RepID=UPI0027422FEC|nr:DUF4238 domain-containing protein [Mycobacterium sp. TY813]MDP7731512.1 DUF4238 domain-containing protein [Mycobacterium sp. TY813]
MATKRPHFVPRTYLGAWANASRQVAYRRRDGATALLTSIDNVAVAGGIYGVGEVAQAREDFFKRVEDDWIELRRELTQVGHLRGERRSRLALFAALQMSRTLKHTQQHNFVVELAASTAERPISKASVRQYLSGLDGDEPDDNEVEAAWTFTNGLPELPTSDMVFSVSMDIAVSKVAPLLESMSWTVHRFSNPVLISSDCPVLSWRAAPLRSRSAAGSAWATLTKSGSRSRRARYSS